MSIMILSYSRHWNRWIYTWQSIRRYIRLLLNSAMTFSDFVREQTRKEETSVIYEMSDHALFRMNEVRRELSCT